MSVVVVSSKEGECYTGCIRKEHVRDWVGLQSTVFWHKGKRYNYDPKDCLSFRRENSCVQNGCVWKRDEQQQVCSSEDFQRLRWVGDDYRAVTHETQPVLINSSTSGKSFQLLFSTPIAKKIRYQDEDSMLHATFYYEVFEMLGSKKKYVVLLPSGTFSNVTQEIHRDPWDDDDDGAAKMVNLTNKEFTDGMVQNIIKDLEHKDLFTKDSVVVFGGHSMGCVLSQKLCACFSSGEHPYFKRKAFPNFFFTGSGAYLWSYNFLPGANVKNFRQKWFVKKNDVFTRVVGTGHDMHHPDGLNMWQMRDAIERGEYDKKNHEWKTYLDPISSWLDR